MRAFAAVLVLLTLAFAGCLSNDKPGGGSDTDPTSTSATASAGSTRTATATGSSTATSTGSGTGAPAATNHAPTAQLAASTAAGSMQANFTMDGADIDGDTLSWELAFGDGASANGTGVPANTTHAYSAGTFTALLTVSDGHLNATASVNVTLAAGALAMQDFEGEWAIGSVDGANFATEAGCDPIVAMDGVFIALFDVDAATIGKPYTASVTAASTPDSIVAWEVRFLDASCAIIDGPYQDNNDPIVGTVPAGAVRAWMSSDGGVSVTGTYHAG